jgi:hypothetical protein
MKGREGKGREGKGKLEGIIILLLDIYCVIKCLVVCFG